MASQTVVVSLEAVSRGGALVPNAAGNGVDDDTAVVNSAILKVANAGGGDVFLPPGDYRVATGGTGLLLLPGVRLRGYGVATRIQNAHATAETVRVRTAFDDLTSYADNSGVYDLHFNPAVGVTRTDAATEIEVGLTRWFAASGVTFGRRVNMTPFPGDPEVAEESRVGTCWGIGRADLGDLTANVSLSYTRGYGYYRFIRAIKTVALTLSHCSVSDANRADAQSVYLGPGTEGCSFALCDFVNTKGVTTGVTGYCCVIDGARVLRFAAANFDTHVVGVHVLAESEDIHFTNCWFAPASSGGLIGVVVEDGSRGVSFGQCSFVIGILGMTIDGACVTVAHSRFMNCAGVAGVGLQVLANARRWFVDDVAFDNNSMPFRPLAVGGMTDPPYSVHADALARGRGRNCTFRTGTDNETWLADFGGA